MRRAAGFVVGVILWWQAPAAAQGLGQSLGHSLGKSLGQDKIDAAARTFMERSGAPGLAIGVTSPAGTRLFYYGLASQETGAPVDASTLFELGSISKTFLVTLAAEAADAGAFRWDDPVSRHVPELEGSQFDHVSLLNLATHTTGGMPLQFPDAVKTSGDITTFFRDWSPPSAPGTVRTYANPSIGLLGVATARALGGDFARLVTEKVLSPLGLTHTFYDLPAAELPHYAQGYTRDGRPVRLSPGPLSTEAYGIRTTAADMLAFVAAQFGPVATDPALGRALAETHAGHFQAGPMTQALIWEWYPLPVSATDLATGNGDAMTRAPQPVTRIEPPRPLPDEALVDKTGATDGFGDYVAFIPGRRIGVVLLANRNNSTALRLSLAEAVFAAMGVPGVADTP